jgi:hypothetical protein
LTKKNAEYADGIALMSRLIYASEPDIEALNLEAALRLFVTEVAQRANEMAERVIQEQERDAYSVQDYMMAGFYGVCDRYNLMDIVDTVTDKMLEQQLYAINVEDTVTTDARLESLNMEEGNNPAVMDHNAVKTTEAYPVPVPVEPIEPPNTLIPR